MDRQSNPPRSERVAILMAAVALHLGLLALLISIDSARPLPAQPLGAMTMVAFAPDPSAGKPPPPALPSRIADINRIFHVSQFSVQPDATAEGAASGCATFPLITKTLVADPAALAAVLSAPPESRSIADAVVIWNAGWTDTASTPSAPLAPAREIVEQSLRSLPDRCLDEPIAGPRLVPVPDGDRTMFVAIGSGNWTWRQLLEDPSSPALIAQLQPEQPLAAAWPWFRQ